MKGNNKPLSKDVRDSLKSCDDMSRRNFAKKLLGIGALSSLAVSIVPEVALAWLDGGFSQREDLADAIKVLVKTYSDTKPYPHKFNDALVKMHLRNLDFSVRKGIWKERAEHYVWTLGVVVDRHIKKGIEMFGKDAFLWGNFERTSCSYQLYEHIEIKDVNVLSLARSSQFLTRYKKVWAPTRSPGTMYTTNGVSRSGQALQRMWA